MTNMFSKMGLGAKDITILVVSSIITIVLAIVLPTEGLKLSGNNVLYFISGGALLLVLGAIWIFQKRINEVEQSIDEIKIEQRKLNEKLKIHEHLTDIKASQLDFEKRVTRLEGKK